MHKWFMESQELANMLLELYEKYEKEASAAPKGTLIMQTAIDYQLKICHAMQ